MQGYMLGAKELKQGPPDPLKFLKRSTGSVLRNKAEAKGKLEIIQTVNHNLAEWHIKCTLPN